LVEKIDLNPFPHFILVPPKREFHWKPAYVADLPGAADQVDERPSDHWQKQ
jgi:hypothetical protein